MLFLKANGVSLAAPAVQAVKNMVALPTGAMAEADFAAWLRLCVKR